MGSRGRDMEKGVKGLKGAGVGVLGTGKLRK